MRSETQLLVRIDPKLRKGLDKVKRQTGHTVSNQVRYAILLWLESQGEDVSRLPSPEVVPR